MAYFAPFIDESGLNVPTYNDILEYLIERAKDTFGNDIYLENDSQDYQWISIIARSISDAMNAIVIEYNQRSPRSAYGAALASLMALVGATLNAATFSTCTCRISGTTGTIINNGIVKDTSGNNWFLPAIVTIPALGYIYVTCTAEFTGPITALIGEINQIVTPTSGWDSVNNEVAAVPGSNVETDESARSRYAQSASLPSRTVLEGTVAAILDLDGVTRAKVYENDTNAPDSNGIPGHTMSAVVEGGVALEIATAIFNKKGPGCGTYGDESVDVTDSFGTVTTIEYYIRELVDIESTITIKALTGYQTSYEDTIKQNVVDYLVGNEIGDNVLISSIFGAALSAAESLTNPPFSVVSVTANEIGQPPETEEVSILFNEVSTGITGDITVVVT